MMRGPATFATIAWACSVALAAVSCGSESESRPNFILVVVDTLRADRLSHAGYSQPSPHFDALARQSVRFSRAYANAPWTLPSLASLFTSQIGSRHQVVMWGTPLDSQHVTLAEVLRQAGYRTAGRTSNVLFGNESGFQQGFNSYQMVSAPKALEPNPPSPFPNAPAHKVSQRGLNWILDLQQAEPGVPFFIYLHYMEPHTPYECGRGAAATCAARAASLNERLHAVQWEFDSDERDAIENLYDGEVAKMDRGLGQLVRALEKHGLRENTWLIVTSDHGEQLGAKGTYLHGKSLDQAEIQVPLLFSGPGQRSSLVDTPVSLIDVAPTILELAGVDAPESFEGRSLVAALEGGHIPEAPVVAEIFQTTTEPPRHRLAVITSLEKVVLEPGGGVVSYDLAADPTEENPRVASRQDLSRALGSIEDSIDFRGTRQAPEIAPEMRERLEALGYGSH